MPDDPPPALDPLDCTRRATLSHTPDAGGACRINVVENADGSTFTVTASIRAAGPVRTARFINANVSIATTETLTLEGGSCKGETDTASVFLRFVRNSDTNIFGASLTLTFNGAMVLDQAAMTVLSPGAPLLTLEQADC